ncbi:MAG: transcription termination factor Rho [Planctomycetes bacterium]|nr:transcription termination factor Rho [Planctomycetota bacterium]
MTEPMDETTVPSSEEGARNNRPGRNNHHRWHQRNRGGPNRPDPLPCLPPHHPVYSERQMKRLRVSELQSIGKAEAVKYCNSTPRNRLILEIIKQQLRRGAFVQCEGILELTSDGHGYVRSEDNHLQAQFSDAFIPVQLIRQYNLYGGLKISCKLRAPKGGDKQLVVNQIISVEGVPPEEVDRRKRFESLTALFPNERLFMEIVDDPSRDLSRRVIDLITPLGKGQRGLIIAPPRVGKTIIMKRMVQSIEHNHPEVRVIVLLIDERPEEVTDMQRAIKGQVIASTFDEKASRHIQVAETALQRAKVLVENGKDVVLFLDSITRLTRAYNIRTVGGSKTLSGGIDSGALQKTKQFFGTARNIENGGSLTLIGTALVSTGSRMDQVIYEEFKGTGNMDLVLDREIANQRIYPAINFQLSGTRKDDLLMPKEEYDLVLKIRNTLNSMPPVDAITNLLQKLPKYKTNAEFLMRLRSTMSGA